MQQPGGLADALFTRTQQRVLGLLFGQPERRFTQRELIVLAASGSGAVQRELTKLVDSALVSVAVNGKQKHYQANRGAPVFDELHGIVTKTFGIPGEVAAALRPLSSQIAFATLYGSVAAGSETAASDVDVLVVSDSLTLEELFRALARAEKALGRRISPTLYTREELARRMRERQPFIAKVLAGKHIVLFGELNAAAPAR